MKNTTINYSNSFYRFLIGVCLAILLIVLILLILQLAGFTEVHLQQLMIAIFSICAGVLIGELVTLFVSYK